MSYKPDFSEGAVAVPEAAIDACGDLLQFRLLSLICSDRTMCEADDSVIAERLLCTADEVRAAAEALRAAELIKPERKLSPSAQSKNLTGEEIAEIIEGDEGFRGFIDECENICGKVFTPTVLTARQSCLCSSIMPRSWTPCRKSCRSATSKRRRTAFTIRAFGLMRSFRST